MADQTLNIDGRTPGVVTAASKWLEGRPIGEKEFGSTDGYFPAVVTAGSKWFEAVIALEDRGAMSEASVEAASGYVNAMAVGQRSANYWTVVPTNWTVTIYKMRGMDAAVDGLYDTWLVQGAADSDASQYVGALATPLRDVIVIDTWSAT